MVRVLTVCTGNICRSPAAELLLAARFADGVPGVAIASAGTAALAGRPVDPPVADLLRAAGVAPDRFRARQLVPGHLREADLVLVMTAAHRSAVVSVEPAALRRTFLLRELAGIAASVAAHGWPADVGSDPATRLRALPRLASAHRDARATAGLEVGDPYRQPPEVHAAVFATVSAAVDQLVRSVR
ncbi:arsenate reductase/protein-tyrosine-phosphatase family protein [Modestobacter sp. SYSU DS0511]